MNSSVALLISAVSLSVALTACVGAEDPASPGDDADSEDELRAKKIGEDDNGRTIAVTVGTSFSITLGSNPSTGYRWSVSRVDRSLGQPKERYLKGSSAVGSGGDQRFTWSTKSPFDLVGKHTIRLVYQRPWAETVPPAKTFEVTVDIRSAAEPSAIFPSDATKIEANSGGGFMPPPPAGSNCQLNRQKYLLDVGTRSLDIEQCVKSSKGIYELTKSNRTLNKSEMANLTTTLNALKVSSRTDCGADAPSSSLAVTTPRGTKKYINDFYACWEGYTPLQNMEAGINAFASLAPLR